MKKLIAIVVSAVMILSLVPVMAMTASAADEGDFVTMRDIGNKDKVEGYKPAPGYEYTSEGFTTIPADFTGTTPKLNIRRTSSDNLKEGLSMTMRVDEFSYRGDWGENDEWISFAIWDRQEMGPGGTKNGSGWLCLIRGVGDGSAVIESFWTDADTVDEDGKVVKTGTFTPIGSWSSATTVEMDDQDREIYTFEVKYDGGYSIVINGAEIPSSPDISAKLEALNPDGDFWISIVIQSATKDGVVGTTITEFNGAIPVGTGRADADPNTLIPAPIMDSNDIPENRPCFLWDAYCTCHTSNVGAGGLGMFAQGDGSYHLVPTTSSGCYIEGSISTKVSVEASDFPIVAMFLRNYNGGDGRFWYCADEVMSASNSYIANWGDFDDSFEDADGNPMLLVWTDLSDEAWSGRINGVRMEFGSLIEGEDGAFDLMWMGCFRSEDEMKAYIPYYLEHGAEPETTEEETGAIDDETTVAGDETGAIDETTAADETTVADETTADVDETTVAVDETTAAETTATEETTAEDTTAADTTAADTTAAATTAEETTEAAGGCASVIGGAAIVLAAMAAAVVLKKKD